MTQRIVSPLARPFEYAKGEHGILLIHGFTGSPAHMRLLGESLRDRGFAVRGICLPGHGTAPEDMPRYTWQDWLLSARAAAREMAGRYRYFSAAGLSMGGVLALLLAEEMELTACVPIAAPMGTVNRFRALAPAIAPFCPFLPKKDDPARAALIAGYDIGYEVTPVASLRHLSVLMRRARQHLSLIRCPVLAVQSRGDRVVSPGSLRIILEGVSSGKKTALWLEEAPHVCTISPEYPKIAEAMAQFLKACETDGPGRG